MKIVKACMGILVLMSMLTLSIHVYAAHLPEEECVENERDVARTTALAVYAQAAASEEGQARRERVGVDFEPAGTIVQTIKPYADAGLENIVFFDTGSDMLQGGENRVAVERMVVTHIYRNSELFRQRSSDIARRQAMQQWGNFLATRTRQLMAQRTYSLTSDVVAQMKRLMAPAEEAEEDASQEEGIPNNIKECMQVGINVRPYERYVYPPELIDCWSSPLSCDEEWHIKSQCVPSYSGAFITCKEGSKKHAQQSLYSSNMGFGCEHGASVGLYILLKNGEQRATLTNFAEARSGLINAHSSNLQKLCIRLKQDVDPGDIVKIVGIIFHEISCEKDPVTGLHTVQRSLNPRLMAELQGLVQYHLNGWDIKIVEELYFPSIDFIVPNKRVSKALELVLCGDPKESYFQTKATGHMPKKFLDM